MPWARTTTGVMDPLTATVVALETAYPGTKSRSVILVSCDLRSISDNLRDAVRARLTEILPELDTRCVVLNATHTHNAPPLGTFGIQLEGMSEEEYVDFSATRIAAAIGEAWRKRATGGISYGLGQAVVGRNRLIADANSTSRMYGPTNTQEFSHVEGYEDHSVNVLCTWNGKRELTGMVVNVAAPSQVSRRDTLISADYWHETREALREALGPDLFVLAQCSAAGDQDTNVLWDKTADERMLRLAGRNRREEIAARLTQAITTILPLVEQEICWRPVLSHVVQILPLPRRMIRDDELARALTDAKPHRETYERMMAELEANPRLRQQVEWLHETTRAFWNAQRGRTVRERFELQKIEPDFPIEVHAVRLGDVAMITNPFEMFLDYGIRIKACSPAVQTFVVQLAGGGPGGYLPTERSIAGGAYGAVPASTHVGPDGGRRLVDASLELLNTLWAD